MVFIKDYVLECVLEDIVKEFVKAHNILSPLGIIFHHKSTFISPLLIIVKENRLRNILRGAVP